MVAIDAFDATHTQWLNWLIQYDLVLLRKQPASGGWSVGQLYQHLINETSWYLDQAFACLGNLNNINQNMSEEARFMFENNSFPDIIIAGDVVRNSLIPPPENKDILLHSFRQLHSKAHHLWSELQTCEVYGKTKHPGLQYFSPKEWVQFSDMHMRHHLNQKNRILKNID